MIPLKEKIYHRGVSVGFLASSHVVTDGYSKLGEDVEYRPEVAERVGIGFDL